MTDFLGHLVARSAGLGEELAPRLRARFEPVGGPSVTDPDPGDDEPPGIHSVHRLPSAPDPAPPAGRDPADGAPARGVARADEPPPAPAPGSELREAGSAGAVPPRGPRRPVVVAPAPVVAPVAPVPPAAPPATDVPPPQAEVAAASTPTAVPAPAPLPSSPSAQDRVRPIVADPAHHAPRLARPGDADEAAPGVATPPPRPPAEVVAHRGTPPEREAAAPLEAPVAAPPPGDVPPVPRREPARRRAPSEDVGPEHWLRPPPPRERSPDHADRTSARTQPTIEVTIGRVEIRSRPAPSAAPRQPAPRAGVLPLAEYLARRSGSR
ncbi:hypothetical protein FHU33_2303 [Blastococcus colisei]|uniref:Uncharacterized protein n=1 Tax=Blastococcus colisei TaxID=1564162 RepID=A0A543PFN9_9ACTN|nr:hypothetical protein [Blastococcus colisei]TQN42892.1 hypothetical protein FHU33_2303 [Blastococcus colisei]